MKRASVALSDELHKALRVFAVEQGTTVNDVLLRGVIKEIDWRDPVKAEAGQPTQSQPIQQVAA